MRQARWPWWHPVLWGGFVLFLGAVVSVALRVDAWADAQQSSVSEGATAWWGLPTLVVPLVAVVAAAFWTRTRPMAAPHVLWRAACNCFVLGAASFIATLFVPDGGTSHGGWVALTALVAAGLGFPVLGLVLFATAGVIDVHRRYGAALRPWDLAVLPGTVVAMIAFAACGAMAALPLGEGGPRWFAGVVHILLTMVGVQEPVRAAWLAPAWVTLAVFAVCLVRSIQLSRRFPRV